MRTVTSPTRLLSRSLVVMLIGVGLVATQPIGAEARNLGTSCLTKPAITDAAPGICSGIRLTARSADGLQRQTSSMSVSSAPSTSQAIVYWRADPMQYHWGLRWHDNTYRADVAFTVTVEDASGRVLSSTTSRGSTSSHYLEHRQSITLPAVHGRMTVRVTTHTTGMYWRNSTDSHVHQDQAVTFNRG